MSAVDITLRVETITPAKAERYLQRNKKNRRLSPRVVTRYAKMMRAGEWMLNGEAIKFNGGDDLLDGQHRLRAVMLAQHAVEMCVIRGLASEAFKTFDQGKARSAGDCLYVLDYPHPNALAAAGRALFGYEMEWQTAPKSFRHISNDELLDTLQRHPKFVDAGLAFMKRPLYTKLIPNSVGMFTYYLARRVDAKGAETFFTELAAPSKKRTAYPPQVLHELLVRVAAEYIKPTSIEKLAWVVTAWNAFQAGKQLPRLSRVVKELPRFFPDPVKPQWRR